MLAPANAFLEFTEQYHLLPVALVFIFLGMVTAFDMAAGACLHVCGGLNKKFYEFKTHCDENRHRYEAGRQKRARRASTWQPATTSPSALPRAAICSTSLNPEPVASRPLPPARARAGDRAAFPSRARSAALPAPSPEPEPARTLSSRQLSGASSEPKESEV